MKKSLPFLLTTLALTGCLQHNPAEPDSYLKPDQMEIVAVADSLSGDGMMIKTIRISSNRSWSAHLNDLDNPIDETDPSQNVSWGTLSEEDHPNVMKVTEETDISIRFNRNRSKTPVNGVLHIYSEGALRKSVSIIQKGVEYTLNVSCDQKDDISDEGMLIPIQITTNAAWTAKVDEESTADANFLNPEGEDSQIAVLRVRSNDDSFEKYLKVTISAAECADRTLTFVQSPINPSAKIFSVPFKFEQYQQKKAYLLPMLVIDSDQIDPEISASGITVRYTTSRVSFEACEDPGEDSPILPTSGLNCHTGRSSVLRSDSLFVKLLCQYEDPDYRDVCYKLYIRTFQFGANTFPEYVPASGTVSGIFPLVFEDFTLSKSPETNPGWGTRMRLFKSSTLSYQAKYGSRGAFFSSGFSSKLSNHLVSIGDTKSTHSLQGSTSAFVSMTPHSAPIQNGGKIVLTIGSEDAWAMQHLAFMEQFKYKP